MIFNSKQEFNRELQRLYATVGITGCSYNDIGFLIPEESPFTSLIGITWNHSATGGNVTIGQYHQAVPLIRVTERKTLIRRREMVGYVEYCQKLLNFITMFESLYGTESLVPRNVEYQ